MKDYYYFLGVNQDDSAEEIRKAYRKISMRCHPDKTDNDPFFEKRFRELREAYETLSDEDRRRIYDYMLERHQTNSKSEMPPDIQNFHCNKICAMKGEEIILSWKTQYADVVKIHPFGLQKSYGEKVFSINEFDENGKYHLILNATNTFLNQTVARRITITEMYETKKEDVISEKDNFGSADSQEEKFLPAIFKWILLILVALILIIYFFFLQK